MTRNNLSASQPPGKVKIAGALRTLLAQKDFNSITTAEIARTAGVNEALIYRYFSDKRGLLHGVLAEAFNEALGRIKQRLAGIEGALEKLQEMVADSLRSYDRDRIFARMLLLEVRNYPGYFESETYEIARTYGRLMLEIIHEGVEHGEIRKDIPPARIRQIIMGAIEHLCLPNVVFKKTMNPDALAADLCAVVFDGIRRKAVDAT